MACLRGVRVERAAVRTGRSIRDATPSRPFQNETRERARRAARSIRDQRPVDITDRLGKDTGDLMADLDGSRESCVERGEMSARPSVGISRHNLHAWGAEPAKESA
jgi:hypothetical protein